MKDFINKLEDKFHLKIGDRELSPLSKASLGLVLEYVTFFRSKSTRLPLIISYPSQKDASLYLAAGTLIQFYLEDYIYQIEKRFEQLNLNDGDRIRIFDEPTTWHTGNKIKITELVSSEFGRERKETLYPIPKAFLTHVNKDSSRSNKIISKEVLNRKVSELRNKRRAIDKILGTEEKYGLNSAILTSKIILVTGKGNKGDLIKKLKDTRIYNEPMSDIFSIENNLILTHNLEEYSSILNFTNSEDSDFYRELFMDAFNNYNGSSKNNVHEELRQMVVDNKFRTTLFREKYDEFLQGLDRNVSETFFNLKDHHPGIARDLPQNIKAVIINDIKQYELFNATINNFLSRNIPVVILTDRHIDIATPPEFNKYLFERYPENYRLNWNKEKVSELLLIGNEIDYIDNEVWKSAICYSKQKISFHIKKAGEIEDIFFSLPKVFSAIQGYENLKQVFWKSIYPLGFLIKNTPRDLLSIKSHLNNFTELYLKVKDTLNESVQKSIDHAIRLYSGFITNPKTFIADANIYVQEITINGNRCKTPYSRVNFIRVKRITEDLDDLCFPGFPFNEKSNRLLADAISRYFIQDLKLLLWEKESISARNYLKTILHAAYFLDNLDPSFGLPNHLQLTDIEIVNSEVESCLPVFTKSFSSDEESELSNYFDTVSFLRHSKYLLQSDNVSGFAVKCNIIHLDGNDYIYLPYTSKIMARAELSSGDIGLKQCIFEELSVGQTVYQYRTKRSDLRSFARADESMSQAFKDLEIWRNSLLDMYSSYNNHTGKLEQYLMEYKIKNNLTGNPSRSNIQRWIYDDDLLCPEEENLRIIVNASYSQELDNIVTKTLNAARLVKSFSQSISAQIKKLIAKQMSIKGTHNYHEFDISIEGICIKVFSREIEGLEKSDILIDYLYTRKIIS